MPKTYAYMRVSTEKQDVDKYKKDIQQFADKYKLGEVTFVSEQISGSKSWTKRKLKTLVDNLEKGDALIVHEITRVGRKAFEIQEVISIVLRKGVKFFCMMPELEIKDDIYSCGIIQGLAFAAQIEQSLIKGRTSAALATKKAKGIKLGRPAGYNKSKLDKFKTEIEALLAVGSTKKFIAKKFGCAELTLYKWLKKNNLRS